MINFAAAWELPLNTWVKVSDGTPPPSANKEGNPYRAWKSHNFVGQIEERIDMDGWRSLKIVLDNDETPDVVDYMAYTIQEGVFHTFEPLNP